jgi:hypothetical protein
MVGIDLEDSKSPARTADHSRRASHFEDAHHLADHRPPNPKTFRKRLLGTARGSARPSARDQTLLNTPGDSAGSLFCSAPSFANDIAKDAVVIGHPRWREHV